MYLKIYTSSEEPSAHPLSDSEIVLGSLDSNDIVIEDSSISRKHLKVIKQGDAWVVVDQGSTNGTFKGDRRLVPGTKEPLAEDEFLRLGHDTFVSLVKEIGTRHMAPPTVQAKPVSVARPQAVPSHDKTRVVSLKDIMGAPAAPKKVLKTRPSKPNPISKFKGLDQSMKKSILLAGLIVLLGYILNENFRDSTPTKTAPVVEQLKKVRPVEVGD